MTDSAYDYDPHPPSSQRWPGPSVIAPDPAYADHCYCRRGRRPLPSVIAPDPAYIPTTNTDAEHGARCRLGASAASVNRDDVGVAPIDNWTAAVLPLLLNQS